jgi:hypothetical protein
MEPMLTAPETKRLKLKNDGLVSSFALNFNLRRYTQAAMQQLLKGRGSHSSTFRLNLSAFHGIRVALRSC